MKRSVRIVITTLLSIVGFFAWLTVAMDYGDSAAIGTYRYKRNAESSTLVLAPDHSFHQKRHIGNREQDTHGTWRLVGQGGISFSKEFLPVSGEELEPDGTTFCDMHKVLGIFVSLRLRQYHVLWYGKTKSDNSLTGTYRGDEPDVVATLVLREDHSFAQEITTGSLTYRASGTWTQDSPGTVHFSETFLKDSGMPLNKRETALSIDPHGSNLQIEISMADHISEPVFYKLPSLK